MIPKTYSCSLLGIYAALVEVEVDISPGIFYRPRYDGLAWPDPVGSGYLIKDFIIKCAGEAGFHALEAPFPGQNSHYKCSLGLRQFMPPLHAFPSCLLLTAHRSLLTASFPYLPLVCSFFAPSRLRVKKFPSPTNGEPSPASCFPLPASCSRAHQACWSSSSMCSV